MALPVPKQSSCRLRKHETIQLPRVAAISVPCGFDRMAMSDRVQIAGRPFAEARVMNVADAVSARYPTSTQGVRRF